VRGTNSAGFTFRDEDLVKDSEDAFVLLISQSRTLHVAHRGRAFQLGRGDAVLLHLCSTARVGSRENFGYVSLLIPRAELGARVACPHEMVMQCLPRRTEVLRLLRGYLCALERTRFCGSRDSRETIRRHIIDLAALTITPHGTVGESSLSAVVAARLSAALEHIAACFQQPQLDVATVARSLGVSSRYLQRLLEMSGTTFTARVNELRLQQALTLLTDACGGERRITDVALDCGFSDISHFNRLFRSRFGDTPSIVRAGGRRVQ
jgi:AraC-like DNA-binding protein